MLSQTCLIDQILSWWQHSLLFLEGLVGLKGSLQWDCTGIWSDMEHWTEEAFIQLHYISTAAVKSVKLTTDWNIRTRSLIKLIIQSRTGMQADQFICKELQKTEWCVITLLFCISSVHVMNQLCLLLWCSSLTLPPLLCLNVLKSLLCILKKYFFTTKLLSDWSGPLELPTFATFKNKLYYL